MLPEREMSAVLRTAAAAIDGVESGFAISAFGEVDGNGTHDLHVHVRAT